jgi:large subunit ribosomal protein L3
MNTNLGLIGKKLGNTQLFLEDGTVARVTAVQVGECRVIGKRTEKKDGYSALVVGFGARREKRVTKPVQGVFDKIQQKPSEVIKEFRLRSEDSKKYKVGQALKPSQCFQPGQKVDVSGRSKGRGFAGVIKRWNMSGVGTIGHGAHEVKRHGGSIGCNMTPGRTLPNKRMAGQLGNKRITSLNLEVIRVADDSGIILIKGSVPGARNSIVTVRGSIKGTVRAA